MANEARQQVPKRIFQTWVSKTKLPANFAYWRASFLDNNPDYAFDLWDDADNRAFISRYFPWFLPVYDAYPAEIYRVDMVRYFYLYLFGGLYADLDTQCLQPLDKVLDRSGVVLGQLGQDPSFTQSVPNAIMASSPREEFWLFVIGKAMVEADKPVRPEDSTGPALLRRALIAYGRGDPPPDSVIRLMKRLLPADLMPFPDRSIVHILPAEEWYPLSWNAQLDQIVRNRVLRGKLLSVAEARKLFPNSSLVTYWTYSWFVGPHRPSPK
jgi:mannosyltransferase OCH1-like enzyme